MTSVTSHVASVFQRNCFATTALVLTAPCGAWPLSIHFVFSVYIKFLPAGKRGVACELAEKEGGSRRRKSIVFVFVQSSTAPTTNCTAVRRAPPGDLPATTRPARTVTCPATNPVPLPTHPSSRIAEKRRRQQARSMRAANI